MTGGTGDRRTQRRLHLPGGRQDRHDRQLHRDAWFVGYTPTLSTAVWIGYPNAQRSMYNVEGVGEVAGGTLPTDDLDQVHEGAIGNRCRTARAQDAVRLQAVHRQVRPAGQGRGRGLPSETQEEEEKDLDQGKKKSQPSQRRLARTAAATTPRSRRPSSPQHVRHPAAPGGAAPGQ